MLITMEEINKKCSICGFEKVLSEYYSDKRNKNGKMSHCKSCDKLKNKKYRENNKDKEKERKNNWREKNIEKIKIYNENYKQKNDDKINNRNKIYYLNNKDKIKDYNKFYRQINKDKIKEINKNYKEKRFKIDKIFKLRHNVSNLIRNTFRNGFNKNSKTHEILGCSYEEFKLYLESKFEPWMNWDNYGKYNGKLNYGWDIDHVIPSSSATTEEELVKLNHYSNLQPLCSYVNRYIKKNV